MTTAPGPSLVDASTPLSGSTLTRDWARIWAPEYLELPEEGLQWSEKHDLKAYDVLVPDLTDPSYFGGLVRSEWTDEAYTGE